MKTKLLALLSLLTFVFISCDDNTDTIGNTLTDSMDHLKISTDTFTVSTRSFLADSVLANTTTGYLGRIKDPETGSYVTGDITIQFNLLEDLQDYIFPSIDSIMSRDDNGNVIVDSCEIVLCYDEFFGDSLTTMQLTAYEMDKPLEEGTKYYSNFSPVDNGYVRRGGIAKDKVYTLTNLNHSDSLRSTETYLPYIKIKLNEAYTDKEGNTYNNYGTYIMRKYYEDKSLFKNAYSFIHNVVPGFHIKSKNGLGAMAYVSLSQMNLYFRYLDDDSTVVGSSVFAGTEEVLQSTKITNDTKVIKQLAADESCTFLKTPAGIFTEMTLPVEEILNQHENDTLNTAQVVLTRINNETANDYNFQTPNTLLMIPRDSIYSFFENNDLPDNKSSFIVERDYTQASSSSTKVYKNTYTFSNISNLIRHLKEIKDNGVAQNANWVAEHPNWNKVAILPVAATYTTIDQSSVISKVTNDMSLTSTRLVGGDQNSNGDIKISIVYSKYSDE